MDETRIKDGDSVTTVVYRWPVEGARAVVQILHGWAEHARRYDHVAAALNDAGYTVVADDHRGHGQTGLGAGGLGDLGPRGMAGVLDAVHSVGDWSDATHRGLPRFLLGHSWGSFLAQRYLRRWGAELAGALLTGTTLRRARPTPTPGPATPTDSSSGANSPAAPTDPLERYSWLTRDTAEVERYVNDPLCGFERMQSRPGAALTADDDGDDGSIPRELPVLIFNGADDRVGGAEGGQALAEHYRTLGLTDVTFLSYAGARHELFNELNRDEVITDVVAWLAAH